MKNFQKGAPPNVITYPMTREQLRDLKPCDLASPRVGKTHGRKMPAVLCNEETRMEAAEEIADVRELVKAGVFPRGFFEKYYPTEWGEFPQEIPELLAAEGLSLDDPIGLANIVHMDQPDDLGRAMRAWLMGHGCVHEDADIRFNDFLKNIVQTNRELAEASEEALIRAFDIKWYYGVPRPEEVLDDPDMTHYEEGSPTHCSWGAGHQEAAFENAKYFFANWVQVTSGKKAPLSFVQKKALFDSAYIWSMARSLAGVHYAVDNLPNAPRVFEA